ncbi:alpha-L-fucosidase [Flagellimonas sp.]|uniref:alpha-L-fucosidase n=1 Tax=Flagellimonas sp. TaxID=2058762 RepID=UPI003BAFEA0F
MKMLKYALIGCLSVFLTKLYGQEIPDYRKREGTRQIHLDFHTSEALLDIGGKFNKKQFQEALKAGNVNSINIFAKGHHGWSYYPTKIGSQHPNLDFDLLKAQIEACHEIGVRVQAYFTIGWSVKDAEDHPEWVFLGKDGRDNYTEQKKAANPTDAMPWGWPVLFPEGAYLDLILKQTEELVTQYDIDGLWYDIIPLSSPNYNEWSKKDMEAKGIDWRDDKAANDYHVLKTKKFLDKTRKMILKHIPHASVFYNWTTHLGFGNAFNHELYKYNTKVDLEDLPTAWGGYDIFPYRAKYFTNTGMDMVAMSGKFHKAWGEFGGFKHKDAIWYEAAAMVAFGASANFGDQLHPSGELEMATYKNIGHAFDYVKKIEDYGVGADHEAVVGMWFTKDSSRDEGMARMLMENQINFVIASNLKDWSGLQAIIVPSRVELSPNEISRLEKFQARGGKLLVLGKGAFDTQKKQFQLDLGVEFIGEAQYDIDYLYGLGPKMDNLISSPFLNYEPGVRVKAEAGARTIAAIREPYFSRTWEHFTSHANTPYRLEDAAHPGVVKSGNNVYIAHNLDRMYYREGARVHREIFTEAYRALEVEPMVEVDLPSLGRINLLHQPEKKRYVLHLLYAAPIQRGSVKVIEDLVPLFNTPVVLNLGKKIKKMYTVPNGKNLKYEVKEGKAHFMVPEFTGHTAVVIEY